MTIIKKGLGILILFSLNCFYSPAQPSGPGGSSTSPLNIWPFSTTNWLTADGHSPLAYTNLVLNTNGDGNASVLVDSNNPAFLQYAVIESDGHTNLTVSGDGTVSFWFSPSWSSADQPSGSGPGGYGRLLEIGAYTTNAAQGWWSLYLLPDGQSVSFSAEDTNGVFTNYLTAPISWKAGTWHFLALTFSATNNSTLYCDGLLLTNGGATTLLPGPSALTNGFFIGSDATGSTTNQAHGAFDDLYTYNMALGSNYLHGLFSMFGLVEYGVTNFTSSAPFDSVPPTETNTFLAVTGSGYLQWAGAASNVTVGGRVYLTNTFADISTNFSTTFRFTIAGGTNGVPYDVFGTTGLTASGVASNCQWYWLGQGYTSNIYFLTNQPSLTAFYVLGTPQDSDGDGLSDAYENLVSHTDPNNPDTSYSGLGDGWYVAYGLNPLAPGGVPNTRLGYWRFNTNSWIGEEGQLPLLATNLALIPSWSSNAVQVDGVSAANLRYADFNRQYGMENINCRRGTVRFWINSDWNSGSGPGATAELIEMGDNTAIGGYWSFSISADGTKLYFSTATNSVTTTYFTNSISWSSNTWHQVALTYAPGTNTILYLDGSQATSSPAIVSWPAAAARATNGLNFGSSRTGSGQSRAAFDELETFNYPLSDSDVSNGYWAVFTLNPVPLISFTNFYVSTSVTTASLTGDAGAMAVLVDTTNFGTAAWTIYNTNVTISLGTNEGWHDVWIGFRALPTNAQPVWQWNRLKVDFTPPTLVVTNPASNTVSVPLVQIRGYAREELSAITYDLTNANGLRTNQIAGIVDKAYDTNTYEFTTNYFHCTDVPLAVGTNIITLHATDFAGNITTTNLNIVLDSSTRTNAPLITLYSPQNGTRICNSNFTWRGWVDDPTATVLAQFVDTHGNTNILNGIVERDGNFWIENIPISGTNSMTLKVTDSASNVTTTNITVTLSPLAITIDSAVDPGTYWMPPIAVTGTISDSSNYTLWVNGVRAAISGGSWTANGVYLPPGGTALIQARAIPNSDNGGNGTGGGTNTSYANPGNPNPTGQPNDEEGQTNKPPRLYVKTYKLSAQNYLLNYGYTYTSTNDGSLVEKHTSQSINDLDYHWTDDQTNGGNNTVSFYSTDETPGPVITTNISEVGDAQTWPASFWPNLLDGTQSLLTSTNWGDFGTNIDPAVILFEHCAINWPFNEQWNHSLLFIEGNYAGAPEYVYSSGYRTGSYTRNADVRVMLQTGGKGNSHRDNLFRLNASAWQYIPRPDYVNTASVQFLTAPIQSTNIQIYGKVEDTNGDVYVTLSDNDDVDVTPQVPGVNYFGFVMDYQKYALQILFDSVDVTETNTTVVVGQAMPLSCQLSPSGPTITNFQWTIPGYAISNYIANDTNGTVYPNFPKTNSGVTYYWVDGGPKQVQCDVAVHNVNVSALANFSVIRPSIDWIGSIDDPIRVDTNYLGYQGWNPDPQAAAAMWLHFGDADEGNGIGIVPGITFTRTNEDYMGYTNG